MPALLRCILQEFLCSSAPGDERTRNERGHQEHETELEMIDKDRFCNRILCMRLRVRGLCLCDVRKQSQFWKLVGESTAASLPMKAQTVKSLVQVVQFERRWEVFLSCRGCFPGYKVAMFASENSNTPVRVCVCVCVSVLFFKNILKVTSSSAPKYLSINMVKFCVQETGHCDLTRVKPFLLILTCNVLLEPVRVESFVGLSRAQPLLSQQTVLPPNLNIDQYDSSHHTPRFSNSERPSVSRSCLTYDLFAPKITASFPGIQSFCSDFFE